MADPVSSICHGRNFMPLRIIQDKLQPFLTQTSDLIPVDLCDGSAYRTGYDAFAYFVLKLHNLRLKGGRLAGNPAVGVLEAFFPRGELPFKNLKLCLNILDLFSVGCSGLLQFRETGKFLLLLGYLAFK